MCCDGFELFLKYISSKGIVVHSMLLILQLSVVLFSPNSSVITTF